MFRLKPLKVYYYLTECGHVIVKAGELATAQGAQFRMWVGERIANRLDF